MIKMTVVVLSVGIFAIGVAAYILGKVRTRKALAHNPEKWKSK